MAARRSGCWPKNRECAPPVSSGPAPKRKFRANGPATTCITIPSFPDEKRVDQVLAWLQLPPEQRPHFITLYYSNVDYAGHNFGPDAPETAEAVRHRGRNDRKSGGWHCSRGLAGGPHRRLRSWHGNGVQGDWYLSGPIGRSLVIFRLPETSVTTLLYADSEAAAEKAYEDLRGRERQIQGVPPRERPAASALTTPTRARAIPSLWPPARPTFVAHDALSFGDPPDTDPRPARLRSPARCRP